MTAPPMPMPPISPPGAPPMGAPMGAPPPPALPFSGRYLPPAQQARLKERDAASAAYLAALNASKSVLSGTSTLQGGAPMPPAGMASPPPAPVAAAPVAPTLPMPPPGAGPLPGMGVTSAPAPAAPAGMPTMARGGMVGAGSAGTQPMDLGNTGSTYPAELFPRGTQPVDGVVPAPVMLLAFMQKYGKPQQMALGGMMGGSDGALGLLGSMAGGPSDGGGISNNGAGSADAPLTPDEQSTFDTHNAGPPAPKAFLKWLTDVAPLSDNELAKDAVQAYQMDPASIDGIFNLLRAFLKTDPGAGTPDLLKVCGLPGGEPDVGAQIWARRQDEQMSRRAGMVG